MSASGEARIVIIGGGVIGLGIAYHLARLGADDVLLVERNQLTSGTSWHAAGIVGPLRASMNLTRLASYATELFPRLEAETGQAVGYCRTGGLWLAQQAARWQELERMAAMGEMAGLSVALLSPAGIGERAPFLHTSDLEGALWVESDAQASPVDLCVAYAKGARAGGVRIREGVACTGIGARNGSVHTVALSSGESLRCQSVVNCAGVWAHGVGALAGVPVPLQAVEHTYVVTEPIAGLPDTVPVVRDLDNRIYIKGDTGKLVLGGFEPDARVWDAHGPEGSRGFLELPENWDQFEPFMEAGLRRIPLLDEAGIQHFMNGPESFTPDSKPLLGESPFLKNFFVAAGFNSTGMMSSAGVGKVMAEWISDGAAPMDLWEVDIARFDASAAAKPFLAQRMKEAVSDVFDIHWPCKQARAGRPLRRSILHRAFADAGAVFGAPTGWERPLWFAKSGRERALCYSYGEQHWWEPAARESRAMAAGVALLELTPLTKIDIQGPDALALMQALCTSQMDVEPGRATYTQMLNQRGGIEADVTVTRTGEHGFRVLSGAATRWKDLAWIERQRARLGCRAGIFDATSSEAVLGVMGPRARAQLQDLTDSDLAPAAFPFATSRGISIGAVAVRATRLSYVGELGWELYVPVELAETLYETLLAAGRDHGLSHAGLYALNACRLEKGFRHWGHDIGPHDTPLEAGLSFTVAWDKAVDFNGRNALLEQRRAGIQRKLLLFSVDGARPLLLHDEPIYRNGAPVGRTTSGACGFRTGTALCLGYVRCEPGAPRDSLLAAAYQVSVGGERYRLVPLRGPAYDACGARMRG